jgi:molybdopterin molybdotransferase
VPLAELPGRRLASPVVARHDLPPGDCSAMDGWAVCATALPGRLRVVGESAAGRPLRGSLGTGEACRISTGAILPPGADAVVRSEDGAEEGGELRAAAPCRPGDHVRLRGEDLRRGRPVLAAGQRIAAHDVSAVAAAGHTGAACARRPRVAFVTTGDELVAPGEPLPPGGVVESNLAGLAAQAEAAGATVVSAAHVRDSGPETLAGLSGLLGGPPEAPVDVVVTVGGLADGPHDHVGASLGALGARWAARGVAMRPGHPVGLAVCGAVPVLALPGNPAAAMVCFHLLGRALLGTGDDWSSSAPLLAGVRRHATAARFVRCVERGEGVVPLPRQGSAELSSIAGAGALAWVEPGPGVHPPGAPAAVSRLP